VRLARDGAADGVGDAKDQASARLAVPVGKLKLEAVFSTLGSGRVSVTVAL